MYGYKINYDLLNNYEIQKRNYYVLQNLNLIKNNINICINNINEIIKDNDINNKFKNLLNIYKKINNKYNNNSNINSNNEIIKRKDTEDNIHNNEIIEEIIHPSHQVKLFRLFRKKYMREIRSKLEKLDRLYKLCYLVDVTQSQKKTTNQRFFQQMIRKWRLIAFTKKMTRRKLELMYKNLHCSYLEMANEIFGDDEVNPSVIKQFEMFGNNIGMFNTQESEVEEELKKNNYNNVDKRYIFKKEGGYK